MTGTNIYYTLDGSAPVNWFNNDAGALSPTAKAYTEGDNVMEDVPEWSLPDTITLRAICNVDGEWSPIVTVRLAVDSPTDLKDLKVLKDSKDLIFDLSGRRITARDLKQGIFIVNGKKRVVR